METTHKKEIEKIIDQMECPKEFLCYESGYDRLCKARRMEDDPCLDCLEEVPLLCTISYQFGGTPFDECPVRVYVAKEMKK